jgi:hypothetical protein
VGYVRGVRHVLTAALASAVAAAGLGLVLAGVPSRATATTCPALPVPDAGPTRLMVAGDSLTQGSSGDWTWRYRVARHLQADAADVDFVGPFDFLYDNVTNTFGNHDYADPCFDQRHYSLAGATYQDMLSPPASSPESSSGIAWAVDTYPPDVVVLLAGGNDLKKGATVDEVLARAKSALDEIRSANPHASVVLPSIPTVQLPDLVPEYNDRLATLAPSWSTADSSVVFTDTLRYWAGTSDTWDGWHPNARGELHIAAAVEDALHELGLGAAAELPFPDVPVGPRTPATLSVQPGDGAVALSWVSPPGADREYVSWRDVTGDGAWTPIPDALPGAGSTVSNLENGRQYAFRVQAAKGTAVAVDLFSNVVTAVPGGPDPAETPSASPSATPSATFTATPTSPTGASSSATPTGAVSAAPTTSPTASPAPAVAPPQAPPRPRVERLAHHRLRVRWSPVVDATGYAVQLRRTGGRWVTVGWRSGTVLRTLRLRAPRTYAVRVQAWDERVPGPFSPVTRVRLP